MTGSPPVRVHVGGPNPDTVVPVQRIRPGWYPHDSELVFHDGVTHTNHRAPLPDLPGIDFTARASVPPTASPPSGSGRALVWVMVALTVMVVTGGVVAYLSLLRVPSVPTDPGPPRIVHHSQAGYWLVVPAGVTTTADFPGACTALDLSPLATGATGAIVRVPAGAFGTRRGTPIAPLDPALRAACPTPAAARPAARALAAAPAAAHLDPSAAQLLARGLFPAASVSTPVPARTGNGTGFGVVTDLPGRRAYLTITASGPYYLVVVVSGPPSAALPDAAARFVAGFRTVTD